MQIQQNEKFARFPTLALPRSGFGSLTK